MIRVSYEYVCDRCGGEIRPRETHCAPSPLHLLPTPAEVKMALGKHLCGACAIFVAKAIEPRIPANKVPA